MVAWAECPAGRTAINTPIQGTAADLIKEAMINIARLLEGISHVDDHVIYDFQPKGRKSSVKNFIQEFRR